MSFGFSAGDFVLLIQLAKATYKGCRAAGTEYNELAREIQSFYGVLKPLRDEAEKPDSGLFRQDQGSATELVAAIDGGTHILEDLQILLAKYEGLSTTGEAVSATKKLWHRFRFSSKIEQLAAVRAKLITYTSTISVLLDGVQLRATGRVEDKLDNVSSQMTDGFESLKKAILGMAVKSRAEQRGGSTLSLLSLSTYAEDDKEVWQEFRRELVQLGFRSRALDRHKDLLQAYMLKLDRSGLLDEMKDSSDQNIPRPWYKKQAFSETANSLPGLQSINEEESASQLQESSYPPGYGISDKREDSGLSKLPPTEESKPYDFKLPSAFGPPSREEVDALTSKEENHVTLSNLALADVQWPAESEESEKETSGFKRPRRVRKVRMSEHKASDTDLVGDPSDSSGLNRPRRLRTKGKPEGKATTARRVGVATEIVNKIAYKATQSLFNDEDEHGNNANSDRTPSKPLGIRNSDTLDVPAAKIGIDAHSKSLYGVPLGNISTRAQSKPSSTLYVSPPNQISGPVSLNSTLTAAAASSKDSNQTSFHSTRYHTSLHDGINIVVPLPQETSRSEKALEPKQSVQFLNQTPRNLPLGADAHVVRRARISNIGRVGKVAQNFKTSENRREEAATNPKDKIARDQFLHDLKTREIYQTASKIQEIPGKVPSGIRTQSPKRRKAAPRATQGRPSLNQTQSDFNRRFKTETRAQVQERSIAQRGNSLSASGLGAVAIGLAGLSVILRMRRKDKTRSYVSDGYSYYSDSYDSLTTDSEDDSDFFQSNRKETEGGSVNEASAPSGGMDEFKEYVIQQMRDGVKHTESTRSEFPNRAPTSNATQANVDESRDGQEDPLIAPTGEQPLNAYMESASESNPELSDVDPVVQKELLISIKSDPGPVTGKPYVEKNLSKAPRPDTEQNHERKETISSVNTSNTGKEASPPVAPEENMERRFVLPNCMSKNTSFPSSSMSE